MKSFVLILLVLCTMSSPSVALQKNLVSTEDFPVDYKLWYLEAVKKRIDGEGKARILQMELAGLNASLGRWHQLSQHNSASQIELLSLSEKVRSKELEKEKNRKDCEKTELEIELVQILSQANSRDQNRRDLVKQYLQRFNRLEIEMEEVELQRLENAQVYAKMMEAKYEVLRARKAISEVDLAGTKLDLGIIGVKVETQKKKIDYLKSQL